MSKRSWKHDPGVWIVTVVVAVLVIGGIVTGTSFGGSTDDEGPDAVGAQVACQDRVKTALKSPATAEFSGVKAVPQGGNTWTVRGAVDSQNSFGALLRSTFTCVAQSDDGETWTTSKVALN